MESLLRLSTINYLIMFIFPWAPISLKVGTCRMGTGLTEDKLSPSRVRAYLMLSDLCLPLHCVLEQYIAVDPRLCPRLGSCHIFIRLCICIIMSLPGKPLKNQTIHCPLHPTPIFHQRHNLLHSRLTTADSERVLSVPYFASRQGHYTGCCTPYSARPATIVQPFPAQPRDVSRDFVHRVHGPVSFDEAPPDIIHTRQRIEGNGSRVRSQ